MHWKSNELTNYELVLLELNNYQIKAIENKLKAVLKMENLLRVRSRYVRPGGDRVEHGTE